MNISKLSKRLVMRAALLFACGYSYSALAQYNDGARYGFTTSATENTLHIIDVHKQEAVETVQLKFAPDEVLASEPLKALVIPHSAEKRLTLIDLHGKGLTQIDYQLSITPEELLLSPLGDSVAIYDSKTKIIEVHALKRQEVLLRVEDVQAENAFTYSLDGSTLFWTDQSKGQLASVDLWSERQSLKVAGPGDKLSAVTRSTDGRLGFISNFDRNQVVVIGLRDMKVLAEVPVGSGPERAWGTTDGQYMLVPNTVDNSVSAISTLSLTTLYTVPVAEAPISINTGWLDSVAAVVGKNGQLSFLEVETGKLLASEDFHTPTTQGVVTSDSKTLTVSSAGSVAFFDMRDQSLTSRIDGLPADLSQMTLAVSNNLCH